ncbi:MAG: amino acid ABC transporter permease [Salinibacterium sp.]|nr:amino acid ABC transporter permease [Salinibacterium sp.]
MTILLYDVPGPRAKRISIVVSIAAGIVILVGIIAGVVFLSAPRVNAGGVAQPGMLDPSRWDILLDRALWRSIGRGLLATLEMAGVAAILALVFGIVVSMARTARSRLIAIPAAVLVEFFRGMPVLLMMLFILLVFSTGAYWAGVGALVLYNGAVIGEALRSGIAALPRGQSESGLALGLTSLQVRFTIEFPQAFRQMLPVIVAQLVVLLKDTSLAYIIGYQELLNIGLRQGPTTFGSQYLFTLFFVVWAVYLGVNMALSWIARIVARRTAAGQPGRLRARRNARIVAQLAGAGVDGAAAGPVDRGAGSDSTRGSSS